MIAIYCVNAFTIDARHGLTFIDFHYRSYITKSLSHILLFIIIKPYIPQAYLFIIFYINLSSLWNSHILTRLKCIQIQEKTKWKHVTIDTYRHSWCPDSHFHNCNDNRSLRQHIHHWRKALIHIHWFQLKIIYNNSSSHRLMSIIIKPYNRSLFIYFILYQFTFLSETPTF